MGTLTRTSTSAEVGRTLMGAASLVLETAGPQEGQGRPGRCRRRGGARRGHRRREGPEQQSQRDQGRPADHVCPMVWSEKVGTLREGSATRFSRAPTSAA